MNRVSDTGVSQTVGISERKQEEKREKYKVVMSIRVHDNRRDAQTKTGITKDELEPLVQNKRGEIEKPSSSRQTLPFPTITEA